MLVETFKQGCTASCVNGYNPSGNAIFTCDANGNSSSGEWKQPTPKKPFTCTPEHCNANKPADQDPHAIGPSGQDGCPAGDFDSLSCKLKCESGYDASDETPYTCGADGKWSGGSLTCTGKRCQGAPIVSTSGNGTVNNQPQEINATNVVLGLFPSTLEIKDTTDDPACTQPAKQRGTFLRGANMWYCDTDGWYYDGQPKKFDSRKPLECVQCGTRGDGMPNCEGGLTTPWITCEKDSDASWETPKPQCLTGHCDRGFPNAGVQGCLQRQCDPIPQALQAGSNESSTAQSDQATCMMQEGSRRVLSKKACTKVYYSVSETEQTVHDGGVPVQYRIQNSGQRTEKLGPF